MAAMPTLIKMPRKASSVISLSNSATPPSSLGDKPAIPLPPAKKIQIVDNPPPPPQTDSDIYPNVTPSLLQDVVITRNRAVGLRVDVQNERQYYSEQRKHTLQAQQRFGQLCNSFAGSSHGNNSPPDNDSLQESLKQVQESHRLLEQIDRTLQEQETQLNTLEDALRRKEAELYDQVARDRELAGGTVGDDDPPFHDNQSFSSRSGFTADSAAPEPSIVQEYYDKIGDVGILRERLFNFESEHQRQLKVREARRAEQRPVSPPDYIFYQQYFSERRALVQDYMTRNLTVQTLKVKCRDEGHDVEEPNIAPLPGRDALDRIDRIEAPNRPMDGLSIATGVRQPVHLYFADAKLRVMDWLGGVYGSRFSTQTNEDPSLAKGMPCSSDGAPDPFPGESGPDEIWRLLQGRNRKGRSPHSRSNSLTSLSQFHGDAPGQPYSDAYVQVRGQDLRESATPVFPSSRSVI